MLFRIQSRRRTVVITLFAILRRFGIAGIAMATQASAHVVTVSAAGKCDTQVAARFSGQATEFGAGESKSVTVSILGKSTKKPLNKNGSFIVTVRALRAIGVVAFTWSTTAVSSGPHSGTVDFTKCVSAPDDRTLPKPTTTTVAPTTTTVAPTTTTVRATTTTVAATTTTVRPPPPRRCTHHDDRTEGDRNDPRAED